MKRVEEKQLLEQKETNSILFINTIATIITGVATLILSILALMKN